MGKNNGTTRTGTAGNPKGLMDSSAVANEQPSWFASQTALLNYGDTLKDNPLRESFSNVIEGELEVTKGDIKTIAYKNIPDAEFNKEKNRLAQDIPAFIASANYLGWADTEPGKHLEAAYFAYYNKITKREFILCLRKMKSTGRFKPYAIISREKFNIDLAGREIHKEKPNK